MESAQGRQQDLLKEVQGRAETYFNSLEGAFQYTMRKIKPLPLLRVSVGTPLFLFLIFSLFPLIPSGLAKRIPPIYGSLLKMKGVEIPLDSFAFWWISCVLVGFAVITMYASVDRRIASRQEGREVATKILPFCYLYKTVKEVRAYEVNKRQHHLEMALGYLRRYLDSSEARIRSATLKKYLRGDTSAVQKLSVSCYDLINLLRDNYFWFKTEQTTNLISSGLENINPRILDRLRQGLETDRALRVLELLTAYEFSSINKGAAGKDKNDDASLVEFGRMCLSDFGREMASLGEIGKAEIAKATKSVIDVVKVIANQGNMLLKHSNIIVCFVSWYVFLSVAFIPFSILVVTRVVGMQMDSTIIVGMVTAPFAAAVAVATAIYTKSTK